MNIIESDRIKEPIPANVGEGIPFVVEGHRGETFGEAITSRCSSAYDAEGLRTCKLELSSWAGVSLGAVHCYARLSWYGCTFTKPDGSEHPRANIWPNGKPKEAESTELVVRRPITNKDIKYAKDNNDGWIPRKGDFTRGFWTEQEARDYAIRCFKEKFGPGWVLQDYDETGNLKEIART